LHPSTILESALEQPSARSPSSQSTYEAVTSNAEPAIRTVANA
jgi:hypothetical protein